MFLLRRPVPLHNNEWLQLFPHLVLLQRPAPLHKQTNGCAYMQGPGTSSNNSSSSRRTRDTSTCSVVVVVVVVVVAVVVVVVTCSLFNSRARRHTSTG